MPSPPRPPALARLLLRLRLRGTERDTFMGDLEERFRQRLETEPGHARRGYWKDALSPSVARFRREARGMDLPPGSPPGSARGDVVTAIGADLRFAVRTLTKAPAFTAVAVLSLALGIGPSTALFSLVHTVLFQDWGVAEPEALIDVYSLGSGGQHNFVAVGTYDLIREGGGDVFEAVTHFSVHPARIEVEPGSQTMALGEMVTGNYFEVMGVAAARGRTFLPEEDATLGSHPVVVISDHLWRTRFGSDPGLVGADIRLEGRPYTVIGVAPASFRGRLAPGLGTDFWVPYSMYPHLNPSKPGAGDLVVSGRVRDGVAPGIAIAAVDAMAARVNEEANAANPDRRGSYELAAVSLADVRLHPDFDPIVAAIAGLLLVAVGLVLLVACVNLAGFLLSRAVDRRKEMAIRVAMGAGRGDIVRQLLIESLLLALVGGAVGLALGYAAVRALAGIEVPLPFPIELEIALSLPLLMFTAGTSLVAAVVFGLAPALEAMRAPTAATLRDEAGSSGGRRKTNVRAVLVAGQMALSTVLIFGASLFLRSLQSATSLDVGFSRAPAAVVGIELDPNRYDVDADRELVAALEQRLRDMPGVTAVGTTGRMPLGLGTNVMFVDVPGVEPPPEDNLWRVEMARVTPGYFSAIGIDLIDGRGILDDDRADGERVAVVSRATAERFWPGRSPIGNTIHPRGDPESAIRIVGVADDVKMWSLTETPVLYAYLPWTQSASSWRPTVVATGNLPAAELAGRVRDEALALDPELMLSPVGTMDDHLSYIYFLPRMAAFLLTLAGLLALVLACLGLYGMVSYGVARRTREMGIRLALGADRGAVVALVLRRAMALVAIGGLVGMIAALAFGQVAERFIFGNDSLDPLALLATPALLAAVASLAAWIPARRASRVDPMEVLRTD